MSKNKLFIFLPSLILSVSVLAGCNKKDDVRVLHVLNSEDYIYECETEDFYCDECERYLTDDDKKTLEATKVHYVEDEEHELNEQNFCETCNKKISEYEVYTNYTCTCHHLVKEVTDEETGKKVYACTVCDETFEDTSTLKAEKNKHVTEYYHDVEEKHEPYIDKSMTTQFEEFWWRQSGGEKVKVVYDTYDTNETMFNELNTGKSTYDVICTSDYMIQKLITNNMLHAFDEYETTSEEGIWENISEELSNRFLNIKATPKGGDEEVTIYDYSVPYMWGTIGIMYNPDYYMEAMGIVTDPEDEKFDEALYEETLEKIKNDFKTWDVLYGGEGYEQYSGTFSIKDSVRDTYAVSLIHTFKDEIASTVDHPENLASVFNRSDEETIALVEEDMNALKANAFGFETDSGKTDMVDQKIGANMCWSGDATWAIWVGEDPSLEERDDGKEVDPLNLYFTVPTGHDNEEASNIWFDALAMCENETSDQHQYELAQAFIEFMCQPENAVQNCDAVGYTPGIAGYDVLEYMYESYDVRGEIGGEIPEGFVEGVDYEKYDLTYFYGDENTTGGEDPDAVLYVYPEYIGRQLSAQYPLEEDLARLAVMNNFPESDTANLLSMWERVRTNALPIWAIVLFVIEGVALVGFVALILSKKVIRKKLKKARL